jgi:GrpB-like predicted nucleotidyltransferase (UPF0157 family)/RimJ/RimL family protein N-acetyltransferase
MSSSDLSSDEIRKIEVVEYDPNWTEMFEAEAKRVKEALENNCIEVHHIGSTSIPGLSAKPVIDMLAVVRDILEVDKANKAMESLGYEAKGENGMAFRRFFQKGKNHRTHHVHVYQEADPEISRYIKFRDWMRSHASDAEKYSRLKIELARKFPHDILQYCNGKDAFVASIDAKDGFDGWRIVKALTDREWDAVRRLRQVYFSKSKEDPYTWTFTHKDHIHFVFYKNAEIIGYAHLQRWPENRAALKIIAIDEHHRNFGFGSQFLRLCERWLYHQGCKKLLIQSSQEAYQFFRKHGYIEMPFNDPDGYDGDPQDIEIGKCLTIDPIDQSKISMYFAPAQSSQRALIHGWLAQTHIKEWIHGSGLQNTLSSLEKFFQGESDTTYWIGYDKNTPFAFLITSLEGKDATTLDLFICDLNYLGKGLAVPMIKEFLRNHFSHVKRVLIDPEATNTRAIHVYQKVGFKIVGEFIASWHPVPHYQMELLMKDLFPYKGDSSS